MYIAIRNHICYFRLRIPNDLQSSFGYKEIKRSLGTCDYKKATTTALALAQRMKDLIKMVRQEPTLDEHTIKRLVDKHIEATLEWIDEEPLTRKTPISVEDLQERSEQIDEFRLSYKKALTTGDFAKVSRIADTLLMEEGLSPATT